MSTTRFVTRRITCEASKISRLTPFRPLHTGPIRENETVILEKLSKTGEPLFIQNLTPGDIIKTRGAGKSVSFAHDDVIGREERQMICARSGSTRNFYRAIRPSLSQYTDHCPRIVTPIYSQDAALIVNLLDLHPTHPGAGVEAPKLEIFEAGTGNGALTLQLARAIHAANPPRPRYASEEELELYNANRRAVVHTLDVAEKHSLQARDVIDKYKGGMYTPNIEFHVGEIDDYLSQRLDESNGQPFLSHAILDLPGSERYMDIVGRALKPTGTLITFVPNLSQIMAEVRLVKDERMPFWLEQVSEVGSQAGVGGREWDVRLVKPKAWEKAEAEHAIGSDEIDDNQDTSVGARAGDNQKSRTDGWEMVCRPKVGLRTAGGGFLGVWKKLP